MKYRAAVFVSSQTTNTSKTDCNYFTAAKIPCALIPRSLPPKNVGRHERAYFAPQKRRQARLNPCSTTLHMYLSFTLIPSVLSPQWVCSPRGLNLAFFKRPERTAELMGSTTTQTEAINKNQLNSTGPTLQDPVDHTRQCLLYLTRISLSHD